MVTSTLLVASAGSGRSLLVVTWLTNTSTTAWSGCISDTAARATVASVLTPFCLAAGATILSVKSL